VEVLSFQVSDIDNIMGLVQTENIMIYAEAYDVALDMSFPKGRCCHCVSLLVSNTHVHAYMCTSTHQTQHKISKTFRLVFR